MTSQSVGSPNAVPWNSWDLLNVPDIGAWNPDLRVSVVLPHYERHQQLELTLAALAAQTYPVELLEIIVADDGSAVTPAFPGGVLGMPVQVVAQDDLGFRAARVRNLGARAATGDVLLFLDCDMIPEPELVEAHARWHRAGPGVVTLGSRRHVEVGDLSAREVHEAAQAGEVGVLFADLEQQVPTWIEGHLLRTDELRSKHDDLFRVVATGNLAVSRSQFWAVGGLDESFQQWGAEDTELGYRLFVDGALLVPERRALCWHQGHGHEPSESEKRSLEEQRAKISHLIAHRGFRSSSPGRTFRVPQVLVEITVEEEPLATVVATVESVLSSEFSDLLVSLHVAPEHPDRIILERSFGGDTRVDLRGRELSLAIPYTLRIRPGTTLAAMSLRALLHHVSDSNDAVGVVRVTVPGVPPASCRVELTLSRAVARAGRAEPQGDRIETAGALFGCRWISGQDIGVSHVEQGLPQPALSDSGPGATTRAVPQDELRWLLETYQRLAPAERTTLVSVARRVLALPARARRVLLVIAARALALIGAFRMTARIRGRISSIAAARAWAHALLPRRVVVAVGSRKRLAD